MIGGADLNAKLDAPAYRCICQQRVHASRGCMRKREILGMSPEVSGSITEFVLINRVWPMSLTFLRACWLRAHLCDSTCTDAVLLATSTMIRLSSGLGWPL